MSPVVQCGSSAGVGRGGNNDRGKEGMSQQGMRHGTWQSIHTLIWGARRSTVNQGRGGGSTDSRVSSWKQWRWRWQAGAARYVSTGTKVALGAASACPSLTLSRPSHTPLTPPSLTQTHSFSHLVSSPPTHTHTCLTLCPSSSLTALGVGCGSYTILMEPGD